MAFIKPSETLTALQITPGQKIVDFGCGTGEYVFEASDRAAGSGMVYAVDVHKDILVSLEKKAQVTGLSNIITIWADIEKENSTELGESTVDAVIFSNVLFSLENKTTAIIEAHRILKQKGKVLVVDWKDSFSNMGPSNAHLVSPEDVLNLFASAGFKELQEVPAGDHHYAYIFQKL